MTGHTQKPKLLSARLPMLIALVAACSGGPPGASAGGDVANTALMVSPENLAIVRSGAVQSGPTISGSLVSENEASVRAQIAATVVETYADVGVRVARGTVLVRLDDRALQDDLLSARSAVRSSETAAQNARRELTRQERLLAVEAVAQADVDAARTSLASAEANLADARARLTSAQQQVGYATVTAPISGVVSEKSVSVGDAVQNGGALFTIVDPASMRLEANVPADALGGVRASTPVSFTVRGYPNRTFEGRITRVSPAADPATRQVRVFATIPNAGSTLVAGLFASGRVASQSAYGLIVPVAAIDSRQVTPAVARLREGQVQRVTVRLGLRDEERQEVQVVSGLVAGDTLFTGSARELAAGTRVTVTRGDTRGQQAEAQR
jgi:membrane fusion protein, multidrug efflux system